MNGLEKLALLKMDFLGLTTLTLIDDALNELLLTIGAIPGITIMILHGLWPRPGGGVLSPVTSCR